MGHWQTSRVYALLGQAGNARRYAHLCLDASQEQGTGAFYLGYAYEALARAEMVAGKTSEALDFLQQARELAGQVEEADERRMLLADLDSLRLG